MVRLRRRPHGVRSPGGHSIAALFRVYAKCLDGAANTANARIGAALRDGRQARVGPPNDRPTTAPHALVST